MIRQGDDYYKDVYRGDVDSRTESGDNGGYKDGSVYDKDDYTLPPAA